MPSNELRALLCGWTNNYYEEHGTWRWARPDGKFDTLPLFDSDLNACVELRHFVRKQGKEQEFVCAIKNEPGHIGFNLMNTNAQTQCAAFDNVFQKELAAMKRRGNHDRNASLQKSAPR